MTTLDAPLTAAELAELRRLEAAMTPGEWKLYDQTIICAHDAESDYDATVADTTCNLGKPADSHNAAGIAALRNAAPRLIAAAEEAERLRVENERLRAALESLVDWLKHSYEHLKWADNIRVVPYGCGSPGPSLGAFRRAAEALAANPKEPTL